MNHTKRATAIILTYNEELHIARAIESAFRLASQVYVVDSMSTDSTVDIANSLGAIVLQRPWTSHSSQFNWALSQVSNNTDWIVRLDADEYVNTELAEDFITMMSSSHSGLTFPREIHFCGKRIHFGGLFPVQVLRAFRYGKGVCEDRLMDEHIIVDGTVGKVGGLLVDNNLNPLSWWIAKHNRYASLEAAEILGRKYHFLERCKPAATGSFSPQTRLKQWLKSAVYLRLPVGLRAGIYYNYRAYARFGIFGSKEERSFHFLQGYWYRYLVDAKITEVENYMRTQGCGAREATAHLLDVHT